MTEHEAFAKLTESLKEAESAARFISIHRSDRRWNVIADLMRQCQDKVFDLAMASGGSTIKL